jgi:cytochrome o ubiquinol oxidase subunit 2
MKKTILITITILLTITLATLYIATHDIPVLNPKGLIGVKQRDLLVLCTLLMAIVVLPVFVMMVVFSYRYREGNTKARYEPNFGHSVLAECIWWGVPFLIIVVLSYLTWTSSHELDPYKPLVSETPPVRIQVVALDWKWLFIYPDHNIATINYIQFPVDTPLNFEITSDAPMNSFWIPDLGGQIYAMPAMRTKLHLMANQIGSFRGVSANISGKGFAGMSFQAVSSSSDDFLSWVSAVQGGNNFLSQDEYQELLLPTEYDPPRTFSSVEENLFDQIIMKYM